MAKYILTADWHFRYDTPSFRNDDFFQVQTDTIDYIYKIAFERNAKVIIAGDIFDRAKPDNAQILERYLIQKLHAYPTSFIPGNHDLLYHRYENLLKGSYGVIDHFNRFFEDKIDYIPFGMTTPILISGGKILVLHQYCEEKELPLYMKEGIVVKDLVSKYPQYDIFVIGDNHSGFILRNNNKIVICPGSITRQTKEKKEYIPFVVFFDDQKYIIEKIDLIDNKILDIEEKIHKTTKHNFSSFVERLEGSIDLNLNIDEIIERYCQINNVTKDVKSKIYKSLEKRR